MQRISLVKQVHERLEAQLREGDIVIDATLGNGFDALFLANKISPSGWLYGFDIQAEAIAASRLKLMPYPHVRLVHASHADMAAHIPFVWQGKVRACLFNLGYLPGGNKQVITQTASTLSALTAASQLLATDGLISIMAYPGHSGGDIETECVAQWCQTMTRQGFQLNTLISDATNAAAPRLFMLCKAQVPNNLL